MLTTASIFISTVIAFGLGDVVDVLESDDLQDAIDVVEAFNEASSEINEIEEYYLGRSVAATVLTMYQPLNDPALNEYVNLVGEAVACCSPQPAIFGGYHFAVLDSDDINALSTPGGFIFICRGLLNTASNEDELAAILAHEVAHVSLKHGISSIDQARWMEFGTLVARESTERLGDSDVQEAVGDYGDLVEDVVTNLATRGYSRETEYQADSLAVHICSRAGYDPGAIAEVLDVLSTMDNRTGPGFWETHPSPEDRISAISGILTGVSGEVDPVRTARFNTYISGAGVVTQDEQSSSTPGVRSQNNTTDTPPETEESTDSTDSGTDSGTDGRRR